MPDRTTIDRMLAIVDELAALNAELRRDAPAAVDRELAAAAVGLSRTRARLALAAAALTTTPTAQPRRRGPRTKAAA